MNLKRGDRVAIISRDHEGKETNRWNGIVVADHNDATQPVSIMPDTGDPGETIILVDPAEDEIETLP